MPILQRRDKLAVYCESMQPGVGIRSRSRIIDRDEVVIPKVLHAMARKKTEHGVALGNQREKVFDSAVQLIAATVSNTCYSKAEGFTTRSDGRHVI